MAMRLKHMWQLLKECWQRASRIVKDSNKTWVPRLENYWELGSVKDWDHAQANVAKTSDPVDMTKIDGNISKSLYWIEQIKLKPFWGINIVYQISLKCSSMFIHPCFDDIWEVMLADGPSKPVITARTMERLKLQFPCKTIEMITSVWFGCACVRTHHQSRPPAKRVMDLDVQWAYGPICIRTWVFVLCSPGSTRV